MIVDIEKIETTTITPWAMRYGQVGLAADGTAILRTYNGVVSLQDPTTTWSFETEISAPSMHLQLLPKGTKITLTTEV